MPGVTSIRRHAGHEGSVPKRISHKRVGVQRDPTAHHLSVLLLKAPPSTKYVHVGPHIQHSLLWHLEPTGPVTRPLQALAITGKQNTPS